MKFGPLPVGDAVGAITAHTLRTNSVTLRKGKVITAEAAAGLLKDGLATLVAARFELGDVGEDEAASRLARAVAGAGLRVDRSFTGRANLYAQVAGLLVIDCGAVDRINAIDESVTLATLPSFKPVVEGEMVATVKIIPYAVPGAVLDAVLACASPGMLQLAPYTRRDIGVISTRTPALKPGVLVKTLDVLRERLAPADARIVQDVEVAHEVGPLAAALAGQMQHGVELIVVFGASAIADRRDVIPTAIEQAGGTVDHFGMPVDPGNLLLVGRLGAVPVIGAPGCARSPKENGFDWILSRLLAGLPVTSRDISGLGVGGLLMEIVPRGQPRDGGPPGEEDSA